ncbi:MAG: thioredoxin family protein [Proteobacteria bacterium]|nr:thioredoxin family protein [Pseudomonadota bacterium]
MKTTDRCVMVDDVQGLSDTLKAQERVIALFHASWCPFCVDFLPIFERCAEEKGLGFLVVEDDQETIGDRYSVEVVPTVLFFEKGKVAKRLDGVLGVGLNEEKLTDFIHTCSQPGG